MKKRKKISKKKKESNQKDIRDLLGIKEKWIFGKDKTYPKAVQLSMKDYENLLETLEDYIALYERRNEPTISHKEFMKLLKKDGLV